MTWKRYRSAGLIVAVVILGTIIVAALSDQSRRGYLDPEGIDESGARAVVELLEDLGVTVTDVRTTDSVATQAKPDTTVVVTNPDLLRPSQITQLKATSADLVLVAPKVTVAEFSDRVAASGGERPASREPGCDLAEAQRAGTAGLGGQLYDVEEPAISCYEAALVEDRLGGARLTVLGAAEPLMNRYLDEDGNAALALGLLGRNPELLWYRPTLEELTAGEATPLTEHFPDWVGPVAWQLGIAALLAALWQGRRLGRIVPERLPVVIRAAEATEGRARLYRKGRARDHAASTLQVAVADRLRTRLGLPRDAEPGTVAEAVAIRTGRTESEVSDLLFGSEPPDDAGLVRLATELDSLEQEVRSL